MFEDAMEILETQGFCYLQHEDSQTDVYVEDPELLEDLFSQYEITRVSLSEGGDGYPRLRWKETRGY